MVNNSTTIRLIIKGWALLRIPSLLIVAVFTGLVLASPAEAGVCSSALTFFKRIHKALFAPKELLKFHPVLMPFKSEIERLTWKRTWDHVGTSFGTPESFRTWTAKWQGSTPFKIVYRFTPPQTTSNGWPVEASRFGTFRFELSHPTANRLIKFLREQDLVSHDFYESFEKGESIFGDKDLKIVCSQDSKTKQIYLQFAETSAASAEPNMVGIEDELKAPISALRFLLNN